MMSNGSVLPTTLEQLPTEIFLQIFVFLSLREFFTAFSGLNSYVDSIIRCVQNTSHIVKFNDTTNLRLLQLFPTQIARLTIVDTEEADFKSLTNLRTLILKYGTYSQFCDIRPSHFPMLEILHIYIGK